MSAPRPPIPQRAALLAAPLLAIVAIALLLVAELIQSKLETIAVPGQTPMTRPDDPAGGAFCRRPVWCRHVFDP